MTPAYLREHEDALRNPAPGFERGIVGLWKSLAELAKAHHDTYGTYISEDGYLGDEWAQILSSAHCLLDGQTGRLDCGTLSKQIEDLRTSGGSVDAIQRCLEATMPKAAPKRAKVETVAIGAKSLTERQRDLLSLIKVEDNVAIYTGSERIPDWTALKSVMTALGGRWRAKKGFVFNDEVDADLLVAEAYETGLIIDPKTAEFFETPVELAREMAAWISPKEGEVILEPSAGRGALVRATLAQCPRAKLVVCEPLPLHRIELETLGVELIGDNFSQLDPTLRFDAVVMNPPFSKRQDVRHITKALAHLREGGRLAAIASAGVLYRDDTTGREFRALVEQHGGTIARNQEGSFRGAGTMVSTVMIKIIKRE